MPSKVGGIDDSIWSGSEDLAGPSVPDDPTARVEAIFGEPRPQRRWTVALRILLALPHLLFLFLLHLLAFGIVVLGWFAALVIGRFPEGFNAMLRAVIRYATRVFAYVFLLLDAYPPFSLDDEDESKDTYPIRVSVPRGHVRRLTVLLRIFLVIPTYLVASFAFTGLVLAGPVLWVVVLFSGRMPRVAFDAVASILRYVARYYSYVGMVTDTYPVGLFGDGTFAYQDVLAAEGTPPVLVAGPEASPGVPEREHALPPALTADETPSALVLSRKTRRLLAVMVVIGAFGTVANYAYQVHRITTPPTLIPSDAQLTGQAGIDAATQDTVEELANAHATLSSTVTTVGHAVGSCNSQLACLAGDQGKIADAFSAFLTELNSVAAVLGGPQLTQLSGVTNQIISLERQLASASDPSTYNAQIQTLPTLLSQFDASYSAVVKSSLG